MKALLKRFFIVLAVLFILLLARFIYYNVIIPWPYRDELKACLAEADDRLTVEEVETARAACFDTYPHFL